MFDFSNNFDSTPDVVVGLIFFFPINDFLRKISFEIT